MSFSGNLALWVDFANALGIAGAVFIAICVCAIAPKTPPGAAPCENGDTPTDENTISALKKEVEAYADDLEARTRWLKYLLFGAAAILIAGVANMQIWRAWPTAILTAVDANTGMAYQQFADASIVYHSFLFALILIAIFVPMAAWMQRNARVLSETAKACKLLEVKTAATWRQENGLTLSFSENIQRILAVLSPILAGPILELIKGGLSLAA